MTTKTLYRVCAFKTVAYVEQLLLCALSTLNCHKYEI